MASIPTLSNGQSGLTCRTSINQAINLLNGISPLTPNSGYPAPAAAGSKVSVSNYTAVDFTTLDDGDFSLAWPETANALTTLSAAVANHTQILQSMMTSFINFQAPCFTPPP